MAPTKVYFNAYDGIRLCAHLYSAGKARPTLIMTQGFSGLKETFAGHAEAFHSAGYTVLSLDNRNWGDSGGEPRNEVDPLKQTRDLFDAFNYASTLPDVDPTKIVYWGCSMAGGNSIIAGSVNKQIKGVIALVPYVTAGSLPTGADAAFLKDRSSTLRGGHSAMVPIMPDTGPQESDSEQVKLFQESRKLPIELEKRGLPYEKLSTVQSLFNCYLSEPKAFIHRISPTPLMMVVAGNDVTSPTKVQLEAFEIAKEPKRLALLEGYGHYDLHFGEGFERSTAQQLEFLKDIFSS